jgi:hypothetical protein
MTTNIFRSNKSLQKYFAAFEQGGGFRNCKRKKNDAKN